MHRARCRCATPTGRACALCRRYPIDPNPKHAVGEQIDELNGVAIYYNGGVNTVQGRNLTQDGYNLGLRRYGHVAIIASVGTDTLHARFHWACSVSRQLITFGPRFESVWAHHL